MKRNTRKNKNHKHSFKEEIVKMFLVLLNMVKLYHWKTCSYAAHKASDELYDSLNKNIDKFVEIMLGKNNSRLNMKGKSIKFSDPNTTIQIKKIIYNYRDLLELKINKYINIKHNTDLLNIRDEILGNLNQFLYLLTLQ